MLKKTDPCRHRIFGVGLSKTGTTSLCDALSVLGFKSIHYAPIARINGAKAHLSWPWWIDDYDAMPDLPVAAVYQELAIRFADSTFILTVRDEEEWLASARKHFSARAYEESKQKSKFAQGLQLNAHMYGGNIFDENAYRSAFRSHNNTVRQYFASYPKFYELDIPGGDGWYELCKNC